MAPDLRLVTPDPSWHAAWREMAREFATDHIEGGAVFGRSLDELADPDAFGEWVDDVLAHERGERVPEGFVASTLRWVAQGDTLLGTIHLRHELNDFLLEEGGHIGYGVRPSARRRGVASYALAQMLELAHGRAIDRVLITCDDDNLGSIATIRRAGGELEDVRRGKRRYWVTHQTTQRNT